MVFKRREGKVISGPFSNFTIDNKYILLFLLVYKSTKFGRINGISENIRMSSHTKSQCMLGSENSKFQMSIRSVQWNFSIHVLSLRLRMDVRDYLDIY